MADDRAMFPVEVYGQKVIFIWPNDLQLRHQGPPLDIVYSTKAHAVSDAVGYHHSLLLSGEVQLQSSTFCRLNSP